MDTMSLDCPPGCSESSLERSLRVQASETKKTSLGANNTARNAPRPPHSRAPTPPSLTPHFPSPSPHSHHPLQEDFERALSTHRALWLAEAAEEKAAFDAAFEARREQLTRELEVKLEQRRAAKNMFVALFFILRLLG